MRIPPRNARMHVPDKRFQNRDASGDITDIDFENPRHGIRHPNERQVFRLDLPRRRRPGNRDPARDDAQSHQAAQGDFGLLSDFEVPQEEDGEGGADEVGGEGEDALCDEYVHDCSRGETVPLVVEVPDFVHGAAFCVDFGVSFDFSRQEMWRLGVEDVAPALSHNSGTSTQRTDSGPEIYVRKTFRKKRARWVTTRNMIRPYRMRFILLNWDKRRRNRQIDILHVASAMKN